MVSTSFGTADLATSGSTRARRSSGARDERRSRARPLASDGAASQARRDVAPLAGIDLDALARVDEERHLDDRAGLERRRLRHVRDRVAAHRRLGLRDRQLDRRRELDARRLAVDREHLHRARRRQVRELVRDLGVREPELLVRLLVHEVGLGAVVVEELDVLHLGVHARELLPGAERPVDDGARLERLQLRPHERAALAGLHVLELDDAPDGAVDLDVHPVAELVRGDGLGHAAASVVAQTGRGSPDAPLRDRRPSDVTSSFVNCVSRSQPSSVTRTRSSIRTPAPSSGR